MLLTRFALVCLLICAASAAVAAETPATVRIVFAGDIMLDGGPGHIVTNGGDPFAAVAAVLRDADLSVGNLECAITRDGHAEDKPYTFKGPKSALPLLRKYFSAVSLANNHSGDWGKRGFADELTLLREAGLPWFGGGANKRQAHSPLVLTANGRRVAFLGYNNFPPLRFAAKRNSPGTAWLAEKDVLQDIRVAKQQADNVILFLHWGEELEDAPLPEQQALARRLIDAGADAIIGAHPHVTQTIDWYKNRPIVYSLGNFLFDYFPGDPLVWKGWIVRLTFGAETAPRLEKFSVELDPAGVPHLVPGG